PPRPPSASYSLSLPDALPICHAQPRLGLLQFDGALIDPVLQHLVTVAQFLLYLAPMLDLSGQLNIQRFRLLAGLVEPEQQRPVADRKSTRLHSSHVKISYAVF